MRNQGSLDEREKEGSTNLLKMTMIVRENLRLKLPIIHGNGKEDPKQHWFICELDWSIKKTTNECVNISLLETTFRDRALAWHMRLKSIAPIGVGRTLIEIQQALFKEFQKPKFEFQYIIETKEIKQ
jgi:hypothetical protein